MSAYAPVTGSLQERTRENHNGRCQYSPTPRSLDQCESEELMEQTQLRKMIAMLVSGPEPTRVK